MVGGGRGGSQTGNQGEPTAHAATLVAVMITEIMHYRHCGSFVGGGGHRQGTRGTALSRSWARPYIFPHFP